jgi:hypothetical protein
MSCSVGSRISALGLTAAICPRYSFPRAKRKRQPLPRARAVCSGCCASAEIGRSWSRAFAAGGCDHRPATGRITARLRTDASMSHASDPRCAHALPPHARIRGAFVAQSRTGRRFDAGQGGGHHVEAR